MTQVTLDNEIITRQVYGGEEYIVGGASPYDSEGPLLSKYGTNIDAYNDQLGTNGYAYVRNVGVVDLADGSLVSGVTLSGVDDDKIIMTDSGNVAYVDYDDSTYGSSSFDLKVEYYDCTAASPTLNSKTVTVALPDSSYEYYARFEKVWYLRPSTSEVGLFINGQDSSSNDRAYITSYDFVSDSFNSFDDSSFLDTTGEFWEDTHFAYTDGGWAIVAVIEDNGSDNAQAFIAQGTGGFTSSTDWDSLTKGYVDNSDWSSGITVAFDYGAVAAYYDYDKEFILEDISGGTEDDLNIYLDRYLDYNDSGIISEGEYYSTGNGTFYSKNGEYELAPLDNKFKRNSYFPYDGVTSPNISGLHGFSNRSLKTYTDKDSPTSEVTTSVYKLSVTMGDGVNVYVNDTTVAQTPDRDDDPIPVAQMDNTCYVENGDEIRVNDRSAHISLVRVK